MSAYRLLMLGSALAVLASAAFVEGSGAKPQAALDNEVTGFYDVVPGGIKATIKNEGSTTFFYNAGRFVDGTPVTSATFNGVPCTASIPPGYTFDCGPYNFAPGQTATIELVVPAPVASRRLRAASAIGADVELNFSADSVSYCCKSRIAKRPETPPPPAEPPPPVEPPPLPPSMGTEEGKKKQCGANTIETKKVAEEKFTKNTGKRRTSAAGKPSPLQGQCTLPPRGLCEAKPGSTIDGGPEDDSLVGTGFSDTMNGQKGSDSVAGKDDNDLLRGGPGRDTLDGGPCDDVLFSSGNDHDLTWQGGTGFDTLNGSAVTMDGGPGDDYVANGFPRRGTTNGGGGNDLITVIGDEGTVSGGAGNDIIYAVNRSSDQIDCGPGRDQLYADAKDRHKGCEKVIIK